MFFVVFEKKIHRVGGMVRSGQVWEHAPELHVAASTFRWYSRGLHLAIPQADAWPIPISLRCRSTCCNHEAHGRPIGSSTHETPSLRESGEWRRQMGRPHAWWLQQVDRHLKEMGMDQASSWGDGQTEAPRVPAESGRSDALLCRILPYLT